jgi:hypothetical protein
VRRDSVVGIITGYLLEDRGIGVRVSVGLKILVSQYRPDSLWGPSNLLVNGYRRLFPPGVKWQRRDADHLPSTNTEVKKT